MKKLHKTLLSILVTSSMLNAQDMIGLDVGTWYMSWQQTSQASSMLKDKNDALNVNYNIDNSLAQVVKLNLNYSYLNAKIEYMNNTLTTSKEQTASSFNLGLTLLDLIPYINVELRYVKAEFSGTMSATDNAGVDQNQAYGKGTFDADVDIADVIIYPFNEYVGVGYRNYNYAFPQDVYITHDESGESILSALAHLKYEGYFYTIALDNQRLIDTISKYNGVVYTAMYGVGKLTPHTVSNAKVTKENAKLIDSYLGKNDAQFIDIMVAYRYKQPKTKNFGYGLTVGYRYNKIQTEAGSKVNNDGYSIRTKFDTEFYGPFVGVEVSY